MRPPQPLPDRSKDQLEGLRRLPRSQLTDEEHDLLLQTPPRPGRPQQPSSNPPSTPRPRRSLIVRLKYTPRPPPLSSSAGATSDNNTNTSLSTADPAAHLRAQRLQFLSTLPPLHPLHTRSLAGGTLTTPQPQPLHRQQCTSPAQILQRKRRKSTPSLYDPHNSYFHLCRHFLRSMWRFRPASPPTTSPSPSPSALPSLSPLQSPAEIIPFETRLTMNRCRTKMSSLRRWLRLERELHDWGFDDDNDDDHYNKNNNNDDDAAADAAVQDTQVESEEPRGRRRRKRRSMRERRRERELREGQ